MATANRKVNLYIAMSLDGYIAKEDDNIDFLSQVEVPDEDYGYAEFTAGIDTVIWGRKTYDKVLWIRTLSTLMTCRLLLKNSKRKRARTSTATVVATWCLNCLSTRSLTG